MEIQNDFTITDLVILVLFFYLINYLGLQRKHKFNSVIEALIRASRNLNILLRSRDHHSSSDND